MDTGAACYSGRIWYPLDILHCDLEAINTRLVQDGNNNFVGEFRYQSNDGFALAVNGASRLRLVNASADRGAATAPGISASTTPFTNALRGDRQAEGDGSTLSFL